MHALVIAQEQAGSGDTATYLGLTVVQWFGLFGGGVLTTTVVTKAWDWWQSRPLFRYSSDPKVDLGGNFVASITQRHNTTGSIIAASVVVTASRWYRWIHKAFHWGDRLKTGIIVSDPARMVTPDDPVQLTVNQNHELRCQIVDDAVLPRRWQPWARMTKRPPKSSELRSAVRASHRSPRYKRVKSTQGFFEEPRQYPA